MTPLTRLIKASFGIAVIALIFSTVPTNVHAQQGFFDFLWGNGGSGSGNSDEEVILSGDFNNTYWKPYKTTLVQADVTAHGGFSIGNAEPYANQATADRLCSLLDPTARASVWRSDSYSSPGNNSIILWNGSSWERHGAKNYNRHLRYQFTCVKTAASGGADLTAAKPSLNSGSLKSGQNLTFRSTITNIGTANALGSFDARFQLDVGNDGVYDLNLDSLDEITNLNAASSQTNTTTVFSGDFHRDFWLPNLSKVQADAQANGGVSVVRNSGAYANQATADRLCSLLDPAARASSWRSDDYSSPGNNHIVLWNGSSWERHGASGYNRHLRYKFTCVKDTVNESEAESKDAVSPIWVAQEGTHAIRACADLPGDDIDESNEENNCGPDYTFSVQGSGISVLLTATPATIFQGQLSLLSWQSQNASFCRSTDFSILGGATQGFTVVTPLITTDYAITCEGDPTTTTVVGEPSTETQTSQSGTWQYEFTDYTDLWCPATQSYYQQCSSRSPEGTSCDPSTDRICAVDSGQCTIRSDVYRCQPISESTVNTNNNTSTTNTPHWEKISGPTFTKVCAASNDPNSSVGATSIQQPFCADYGSDYPTEGSICPTEYTGQSCKSHGWQYEGACAGQGTVYDYVTRYQCSGDVQSGGAGGSVPIATDRVTVTVLDGSEGEEETGEENGLPQCSDGIDNDGDGLTDYPNDPGCLSPNDNDERNAQCSDGVDNDGDGNVDYPDDIGCSSVLDDDEGTVPPASITLEANPTLIRSGKTTALSWVAQNVEGGSCTLSGSNGDFWILTGVQGSETTSSLDVSTSFTLSCTDFFGDTVSMTLTVSVIPSFKEI